MKRKQIDPRIANKVAARQQAGLLRSASIITTGKHNGSKKKSTLVYLSHSVNNRVANFLTKYGL